MKQAGDWWVADRMSGASSYVGRAIMLIDYIKQNVTEFGVAVQAGGHVGTLPRMLSELFRAVYTFEPEHENFSCLVRNAVEKSNNVFAARGFVGNQNVLRTLMRHKNSGGHQVGEVGGDIPMYRIDDLGLSHCNLLCLDTEGYEVPALLGALDTIARHRPMIVAEENKQMLRRGYKYGDIEKLLSNVGYSVVDRVGEDIVLKAKQQ